MGFGRIYSPWRVREAHRHEKCTENNTHRSTSLVGRRATPRLLVSLFPDHESPRYVRLHVSSHPTKCRSLCVRPTHMLQIVFVFSSPSFVLSGCCAQRDRSRALQKKLSVRMAADCGDATGLASMLVRDAPEDPECWLKLAVALWSHAVAGHDAGRLCAEGVFGVKGRHLRRSWS
jgi:hypothetical protein